MSGKTPSWMPELFFSHRKEFCIVADQLGFRLGTRADQMDTNSVPDLLEDGFEIDFVDNNFDDPDEMRIVKAVDRTEPAFVVLPDIYECDTVDSIIDFGIAIQSQYDTTPIVVPKCDVAEEKIPEDWVIGFSVPSGYGGTEIPITKWRNHRIHLLGGSPKNQIKYANRAHNDGVTIFSVDGNCFSKASGFGNIINEPSEILDTNGNVDSKAWVADADGYTDWGQRIAVSLSRYYELWRQWSMYTSDEFDSNTIKSNI